MTDEEIIKALPTVAYGGHCCMKCKYRIDKGEKRCGIKGCNIARNALDLINQKNVKIEELEIELQAMRNAANGYKAEFERLMPFDYQVEVSKKIEQEIKSEAIKELAERLKEKFGIADCIVTIDNNDIDNLLKEMEEQENDRA